MHMQGEKDLWWPAAGLHLGAGGGIHAILSPPSLSPFARILLPPWNLPIKSGLSVLVKVETTSQALTCALVPTPHTSVQTAQFK